MASVRSHARSSFDATLASAKRTMLLSEIVRLAVDNFRASKVRFALTSLGMVIGAASVIFVFTISLTGKQYILSYLQSIGSNMVELEFAGGGAAGATDTSHYDYLTRDDERAVDTQVADVAYSSPMLELHESITFPGAQVKDVLALGVSPEYKLVRNLIVVNGRFFDQQDENTHAHVALVTGLFAREMFGSAANAVNQTIQISGLPITVIGVFKEMVDTYGQSEIADETLLMPYTVARYFTGTDNVKQIFFSARDQANVEQTAQEIVAVVHARHQRNSVYRASTLTSLLATANYVSSALTVILLLVAAVTLAVGGVGIMNIMLATVRSRIREIGIRKALGATAREIKLQFLIEAVFISLTGGIIGTAVGLGVPLAVRFFTQFQIPISAWSVVVGLGTSTAVGIIFGTLPANRAAQLDPVESLKYE